MKQIEVFHPHIRQTNIWTINNQEYKLMDCHSLLTSRVIIISKIMQLYPNFMFFYEIYTLK